MKTLTLHGLTQCLEMVSKAIESNIVLDNFSKKDLLSDFYFDNFGKIFSETEKMDNINYGVFSNKNDVDEWLKKDKKLNVIKNVKSTDIYSVSFYDFDQKWKTPFNTTHKIKDEVTQKEYVSFGIKGGANKEQNTFITKTEKGSVLVFYPKSKNVMDLYQEAYELFNDNQRLYETNATLPEFNIVEEMDYQLKGTMPFNTNLIISEAKAKNNIKFDKKGAKATSEVKVSLMRGLSVAPMELIFKKNFAVAIFDIDNQFPSIVSFVKKEDWLLLK